jgi:hypothetical protein
MIPCKQGCRKKIFEIKFTATFCSRLVSFCRGTACCAPTHSRVIEAIRVAYMKFRGYSFVYASFYNGLKELNQATTFDKKNPTAPVPLS